ncbi:MAG: hypothetical protein QW348_05055 [Ignisphaera sp.]
MSSIVDAEYLKKEILKLLREDEEFRLAVAGLIGFGEVLKRLDRHEEELKRLREDFLVFVKEQERKWEENNRRWEENSKRWEEAYRRFESIELELKKLREDFNKFVELEEKRWEENNRRWEENNKRWEENNRRWEEAYKRFEAIERRLEEHTKIIMELVSRVESLEHRVSNIELALGALTEASIARYLYEDLVEELSARGEKVLHRIRNHRVDNIDIDLFIETDKTVYVVEIKVKPRYSDVGSLIAKVDVVKSKYPNKNVVGILAATLNGREVEEYAKQKGVDVYRF